MLKKEKINLRPKRYFPSRITLQSWVNEHKRNLLSDANLPLATNKKKHKNPLKNMKVITDGFYVIAKETQSLIFKEDRLSRSLESLSTSDHGYRMI